MGLFVDLYTLEKRRLQKCSSKSNSRAMFLSLHHNAAIVTVVVILKRSRLASQLREITQTELLSQTRTDNLASKQCCFTARSVLDC